MTANDRMMVYLPGEVRRGLRIRAAEEGRHVSDVVVDAVVAILAGPAVRGWGSLDRQFVRTSHLSRRTTASCRHWSVRGRCLNDLALRLDRDAAPGTYMRGSAMRSGRLAVILAELTRAGTMA